MAVLTPEQQQEFARRRLGLQNQATTQRTQLNEDFTLGQRLLGEQNTRGQADVANQMAGQGLYQSGIRVNEQGNVQREYNERLSDLTLNRTRGLQGIESSLSTGLADLSAQQAAALAAANRQEQEENARRAELEAIRRAAAVQAPQMRQPAAPAPPPPQPQLPVIQYRPPVNGGQFQNWPAFKQANPDLAALYTFFAQGDENVAASMAISNKQVLGSQARPAPLPGRMGRF